MGAGASTIQKSSSLGHAISEKSSLQSNTCDSKTCFRKGDPIPSRAMDVFTLFSMRFCPYSQRVRLVLEYKGIPYQLVHVALKDSAPEWLKERNPQGTVPILEKEARTLHDSLIVMQYLDECKKSRRLTPTDSFEKARQSMRMQEFGKVEKAFHEVVNHLDSMEAWNDLKKGLKKYSAIKFRTPGEFFGGSFPSLLDFVVWPFMERLPALALINAKFVLEPRRDFMALLAWEHSMLDLAAVQACLIDPATHAYVLKSFGTESPAYGYGLLDESGTGRVKSKYVIINKTKSGNVSFSKGSSHSTVGMVREASTGGKASISRNAEVADREGKLKEENSREREREREKQGEGEEELDREEEVGEQIEQGENEKEEEPKVEGEIELVGGKTSVHYIDTEEEIMTNRVVAEAVEAGRLKEERGKDRDQLDVDAQMEERDDHVMETGAVVEQRVSHRKMNADYTEVDSDKEQETDIRGAVRSTLAQMDEVSDVEQDQNEDRQTEDQEVDSGENVTQQVDNGENVTQEVDSDENVTQEVDSGENVTQEVDRGENVTQEVDRGENVTQEEDSNYDLNEDQELNQTKEQVKKVIVISDDEPGEKLRQKLKKELEEKRGTGDEMAVREESAVEDTDVKSEEIQDAA